MNTENSKPIPKAQQMLIDLAEWACRVNQFDDVKAQQKALNDVKVAYLTTTFADDNEARNNALMLFQGYEEALELLASYKRKAFEALPNLTQKLWHHDVS